MHVRDFAKKIQEQYVDTKKTKYLLNEKSLYIRVFLHINSDPKRLRIHRRQLTHIYFSLR